MNKEQRMYQACVAGNQLAVRQLVENGWDVNCFYMNLLPLHVATLYERYDVLELLIERGAFVNATSLDGKTPLLYAVEKKFKKGATLLIHSGAKVDIAAADKKTPLHVACSNGDLEMIQLLLDNGGKEQVAVCDKYGNTPICYLKNCFKSENLTDTDQSKQLLDVMYSFLPLSSPSLKLWPFDVLYSKGLSAFTSLRSLALCCNTLDNDTIGYLQRNTTVTNLLLRTNWGDVGAAALAINTHIRKLDLNGNQITFAGAKSLAGSTTVTSLVLDNNDISDKGAKALSESSTLLSLSLKRAGITDECTPALANNSSITILNLGCNKLGDFAANTLAANSTIRKLGLSHNQISDSGVQKLAGNSTITALKLYSNPGITAQGVLSLIRSSSLIHLNVGGNKIYFRDSVAPALAACRLTVLDLSYCRLPGSCFEALAANNSLTKLNVSGTKADDTMVEILARNNSITSLSLAETRITHTRCFAHNTAITELTVESPLVARCEMHVAEYSGMKASGKLFVPFPRRNQVQKCKATAELFLTIMMARRRSHCKRPSS